MGKSQYISNSYETKYVVTVTPNYPEASQETYPFDDEGAAKDFYFKMEDEGYNCQFLRVEQVRNPEPEEMKQFAYYFAFHSSPEETKLIKVNIESSHEDRAYWLARHCISEYVNIQYMGKFFKEGDNLRWNFQNVQTPTDEITIEQSKKYLESYDY